MKDNNRADFFRAMGNSFYNKNKFLEALTNYNRSLCYAQSNSKQMALAYANRSAIYMELKEAGKCLENIQLARDNKYPNQSKLNEREQKCFEVQKSHTHDPENDPLSFFKLSYPPNEKIPFIVNCLKLRRSNKYGRHIITNQELMPGDIIAIEEPFLKLISHGGRYRRCTYCLKSNLLNLIPCDGDCSSGEYLIVVSKC